MTPSPRRKADFLRYATAVDGIPVVRDERTLLRTPLPLLFVLPDGNVKLCIRSTFAVDWDPDRPISAQING